MSRRLLPSQNNVVKLSLYDADSPEVQSGINLLAGAVVRRFIADKITVMTPQEVFDGFWLLPPDGKKEFLLKFADSIEAELLFAMSNCMNPLERERFANMVFDKISVNYLNLFLRYARAIAREHSDLSDEAFDEELYKRVDKFMTDHNEAYEEVQVAKMKASRDRKSDPETIRRNAEICMLRKQDPKTWTQGRLQKKYDITPRAIRKIIEEEAKWFRLSAALKRQKED